MFDWFLHPCHCSLLHVLIIISLDLYLPPRPVIPHKPPQAKWINKLRTFHQGYFFKLGFLLVGSIIFNHCDKYRYTCFIFPFRTQFLNLWHQSLDLSQEVQVWLYLATIWIPGVTSVWSWEEGCVMKSSMFACWYNALNCTIISTHAYPSDKMCNFYKEMSSVR